MIEVFISFPLGTPISILQDTMEAWNLDGLEPVAVQVKPDKFELHRRVTAEKISTGNYILASLGCGPVEPDFEELAEKVLAEHQLVGLFHVPAVEHDWTSGRVALCRKGIVTHWIMPSGSQEKDVLYASAHGQSYKQAGYETIECPLIHYRRLSGSLPS